MVRIELDTAHVGLTLNGRSGGSLAGAPQLDCRVIGSRGQYSGRMWRKVDAPHALAVLVEPMRQLAGTNVPQAYDAIVITARNLRLDERAPAQTTTRIGEILVLGRVLNR